MAKNFIILKRFAMFLALWLALSGAAWGGLPFGLATAALATWASLRLLPTGGRAVKPLSVLAMAPGFLWRSVRGGVDVAWRALDPRLPIEPGWVAWRTKLPRGGARVSLGSELSLLPGTLVAGSRGDTIFVHCLDTRRDIAADIAEEEARIAKTIGSGDDG